jgi:hypothetical protein
MAELIDLIRSANPGIDDLADDDLLMGVMTPGVRTQTQQEVIARYKASYQGSVVVQYDRIALDVLFRGTIPEVVRTVRIPAGPAGQTILMASDLIDELARRTGIDIRKEDIVDVSIPKPESNDIVTGRYQSQVIVVAAATSPRYTGSFTLRWVMGGNKPHISQFFTSNFIRGVA